MIKFAAGGKINGVKQAWKQFSNTTVAPPIFNADSAIQAEGRCMAELLEKIGGKRPPWLRKFVSKAAIGMSGFPLPSE